MTEKLPPIPPQSPGQNATLNLSGGTGSHWLSPDQVREYIAEAKREMLAAPNLTAHPAPVRTDEGRLWSFLRKVMSQGGDIQTDAAGYEMYSARLDAAAAERTTELLAVLNASKPLAALTDEQIKNVILSELNQGRGRYEDIYRAANAEFCRLNGLTEPKP